MVVHGRVRRQTNTGYTTAHITFSKHKYACGHNTMHAVNLQQTMPAPMDTRLNDHCEIENNYDTILVAPNRVSSLILTAVRVRNGNRFGNKG